MDIITAALLSRCQRRQPGHLQSLIGARANLATHTWRTDVDITGPGYIEGIYWFTTLSAGASACKARITVDGGTPREIGSAPYALLFLTSGGQVAGLPMHVRFKTSLKVEVYNGDSATQSMASHTLVSLTDS